MQTRIDLYVNKTVKEFYDQLQSIADIENVSLASKVGQAVEYYIRELGGTPKLISDKKVWDSILNNCSKDELLAYNTLISQLNSRILKKLC